MTTHNLSAAQLVARLFIIPAWLEPRLQSLGAAWWRWVSRADARAGWRWLALHWQKVAAWWLTCGLGLSVVFLLVALASWQNPEVMLMRALGWSSGLLLHGGKLAAWGGLAVLVLALPVILPAALLSVLVLLAGVVALGVFGPLLLVSLCAFGVLLLVAMAKRGGSWLLRFVAESLGRGDEKTQLATIVRDALGLNGSSSDVQGKPRLMVGDELARYVAKNKADNRGAPLLLGKVDGKPFFFWTEKHVYLTASSRSGKGRDLIVPNLRIYPESVFVLDPKGENCTATAAERERKGNRVAAFDPYKVTSRPGARFNPLAAMGGGQQVRGADYLAEALIIGDDDHWNESARALIRALVLHLLTCPDEQLRGRARDLPTLRELLTGALDVTLNEMAESKALDGLVSRLAESILDIPPNEQGSIISTARRGTKWLDNPELADMFRAGPDCISFDDLRDPSKRLSVFVCLPPDVFATYPQVCRLLTTFALDTMMRTLTGRKRPVMFILDELAQLKHLPIVERAFTLGAGFGVQVWAVFQSVEQARKLYPLDSLYGSAGFRGFFKVEDPETVEFASKCASGVLTPADVRHLPELGMLALLDGANPLIVERLGPTKP
jgi:type IV secretion system protein VirD4